ncbi:thiamine kinase [Trabulsiella odontotermitis]|uniref:thiamine kinase n=1 Tax=Trabulsiella odontotermitis TaxID=379893 RepID=UPI0006BA1DCF|nr:thiamine kinase [Trabulsiella odontotermitis]
MQCSNSKLTRDAVLSRFFPDYQPAANAVSTGLSGGSCIIENGDQRLVLRQHHTPQDAEYHFLRQYHALSQLPDDLAPRPRFYTPGWMAVDYFAGEVKSALPEPRQLAAMLYYLHQQPRFGWRISLLPLLQGYWQQSAPARRTPFWLRQLHRLRKAGEPVPLRLAPLHMDIHAGNIVHTAAGLRLIDWEYAGDGDIALELAAVWVSSDAEHRQLVGDYAALAKIEPQCLWRQVQRWRPWLLMLKAGWFECRWVQTGEQRFITLADETWCQLKTNG